MKEITVQELKAKIDRNEAFQLIDIREPYEYEICNLEAILIPMGNIFDHIDKIATDKPVIIHCKSGARSAAVISELERKFGMTNLFNLKGGILAWATQIDHTLPTY